MECGGCVWLRYGGDLSTSRGRPFLVYYRLLIRNAIARKLVNCKSSFGRGRHLVYISHLFPHNVFVYFGFMDMILMIRIHFPNHLH